MNSMKLYGAVEAGGTKFKCAIARLNPSKSLRKNDLEILLEVTIPTNGPAETIHKVFSFFKEEQLRFGQLKAIGVGSFGPVNLDQASDRYGEITASPKIDWNGISISTKLEKMLDVPVHLDTDVNSALLAEARLGCGAGLKDLAYITVGTGIGCGLMVDGKIISGQRHPEIGHITLPLHHSDQDFQGVCPFHGARCAEGLASGPAMIKRLGCHPNVAAADHSAWRTEGYYLAALCMNVLLTTAPQKIIMGGGVMQHSRLLHLINTELNTMINGYAGYDKDTIEKLISLPALADKSGVYGCLLLALGDTTPA